MVVFVRSRDEVRKSDDQSGQGDQDGTATDESGPVDAAAKVADKDDQHGVAHLGRQMVVGGGPLSIPEEVPLHAGVLIPSRPAYSYHG